MEKTNRQEGETHVNDCKVKQRERRERKGRRKAENMVVANCLSHTFLLKELVMISESTESTCFALCGENFVNIVLNWINPNLISILAYE